MTKREIRADRLEARRRMAADEVEAKSRAIIERLWLLAAFASAQTVLTYVSSKDNEVDTHRLIDSLLRQGKRVLVPVAEPDGQLLWSELRSLDELAPGRFGILEPREECRRLASAPNDAAVIVPGVAFSPGCWRIGYGGGYFDRFLADHGGASIALAFDLQIVAHIEPEPYDVSVDWIVTESRVFQRRDQHGTNAR